jgi:DNA-binding MarR family transcriptional regulator
MVNAVKQSLAHELRPILLRLERQLRRESHAFGVTGAQVSLLARISHQPGITASELVDREGISAPAVSPHLIGLEETGLIRKDRSSDRRRAPLSLTTEGRRVLRAVKRQRTAWLADRLDRLPPDDQAAIEAAIGPLEALLDNDSG